MSMETHQLKNVLEALIFASDTPLTMEQLRQVLGREASNAGLQTALEALKSDYRTAGRGLRFEEVAGGYRIYTRPEYSQWIRRLIRTRQERRFSVPALETLAIVAYRQPITKAEIEMVRGVNSDGVLETLLERGLVKIRGRREGLGRPILYGTTREFLEYFGLSALEDLPGWGERDRTMPSLSEAAAKISQAPESGQSENETSQDEPKTTQEAVQETSQPD